MNDHEVKIVKFGADARKSIKNGIFMAYDAVRRTIGPGGKNALVKKDNSLDAPRVTNDGVFIARHINLEDECENDALQNFVESARETDLQAGDGTSTCIVIAGKVILDTFEDMGDVEVGLGGTVRKMREDIAEAKDTVIEKIKERAKPVESKERLSDIATISVEDEELGATVADIVWETGKDGFVDVKEGYNGEIEYEFLNGMKKNGRYAARAFVNNFNRRTLEAENLPILTTSYKLENFKQIEGSVLKQMWDNNYRSVCIFAHNFTEDFLKDVIKFFRATGFTIYPVKMPGLTSDEWDDVAIYTNAHHFSEEKGDSLANFQLSHLGGVERVVASEDEVIITGGAGDKEKVDERIAEIKHQIKTEDWRGGRKRMERRVGDLSSGVGVIKVGASTEVQAKYLRHKIEDAVFASQAALAEGYVAGGGLTLKEISDELGEDNILYEALRAPYNQIQENAGGGLEIGDNVIDPAKVTRLAVENACGVAGDMITADVVISHKRNRNEYDGLHELGAVMKDGVKVTKE